MKELFSISVSLFMILIFLMILTFSDMVGYFLFVLFLLFGILYICNIFFNVRMPDSIVALYKKLGIQLKKISPEEKATAKPISDIYSKISPDKKETAPKETPMTSDTLMPKIDTTKPLPAMTPTATALSSDQAFHVKGGFDYTMARAVCRSYGATLATYDQIENAHKKGAEWCEYGWSEDGMVLYPTQRSSWAIYQESDQPQKCGIPGVNGGYNSDEAQQLGANCYGKKPDGKPPPFAYPPKKKVSTPEYEVSPFNYSKWNI
jgi:hypothetical protein